MTGLYGIRRLVGAALLSRLRGRAYSSSFLVLLALGGGTCHGQSSGNGADVQKDNTTAATGHDVTIPGVDTSALTLREKREWSQYVSEFLSPCSDTPVPISQCVEEKRACTKCIAAAKYVLKGVRDGLTREQIEKSYKNRFDASKIKDVPIDGSPTRGPEGAPITIVEFADFECPHCGLMAPKLDKLCDDHKQEIRFVFKFFPLPAHPHGEPAARAAIAAWQQNKFWEMHHKLFAGQQFLGPDDIRNYAKDIGLDIGKFNADAQSQATTDRIARDRKLGEGVEIKGTPAIFINGREYDGAQDLEDWVKLELGSSGGSATPPTPATQGSALAPIGSAKGKGP
jgi:protein-disulfide isomerase